jgi:hypothetical protein
VNRDDHSPWAMAFTLIVMMVCFYLTLLGIDLHVQERDARIKLSPTALYGGGYGDAHLQRPGR